MLWIVCLIGLVILGQRNPKSRPELKQGLIVDLQHPLENLTYRRQDV